jgi:hypothetical protein
LIVRAKSSGGSRSAGWHCGCALGAQPKGRDHPVADDPYLTYWVPEHLGGSGVSRDRRRRTLRELERAAADLGLDPAAGHLLLDLIIYLIESLVFLVTGLQAARCWRRHSRSRSPIS